MKGAFSIMTILGLVAAFGGISIVMGSYVEGPIAEIIDTGTQNVEDKTDYTIDITNQDQLSDLMMLTYHRASEGGCAMETASDGSLQCNADDHPTVCHQRKGKSHMTSDLGFNEKQIRKNHYWPYSKGYPHLEGTYLGTQPSCAGLSSTAVRGTQSLGSGNDMEGIYSREYFEIQEPITLRVNEKQNWKDGGRNYLEYHLKTVSKKSFREKAPCSGSNFLGRTKNYALFFESGMSVSDRVDDSQTWWSNSGELSPYCGSKTIDTISHKGGVQLCPGDKGYVQVNKDQKDPLDEGDAGANNAHKFPYVQITDINQTSDCEYVENPHTVQISDIRRVQRATGDNLRIKVEVTNNKNNARDYSVKMIHHSGVIGKKGMGSVGPGDSSTIELNSGDLTPNPKSVADINPFPNCEVKIKVKEKNGATVVPEMAEISAYKDINKQSSQLNEEGCLDTMARDADVQDSSPLAPSVASNQQGAKFLEFTFDVKNVGNEETKFRANVPTSQQGVNMITDRSELTKKLNPGDTKSYTAEFAIKDPSAVDCPSQLGIWAKFNGNQWRTDLVNLDVDGVNGCGSSGGGP